MERKLSAVAIGAAVLLTLTACTGAPEPAAPGPGAGEDPVEITDLDSLVEAAKAEGSLSIYGQVPEASLTAFAEGFTEKYGIPVEALRLGGNTLSSRFEAEAEAGTPSADLIIAVDVEYVADSAASGNLVPFSESGVQELVEGFPEEAVFESYDAPMLQVLDIGYIFNTEKVEASELPTSWDDLSSDRWAGKYCAVDPETSVNVGHFFWKLREIDGEQAVVDFGKNVGRWYPNVIAMNEAVAVGECELGVGSAKFFVALAQANDAPVEYAPQPMSIRPLTTAAISTKAAHPYAAQLFMHYILSEEGNALLNDPEVGSLGPWDLDIFPEDFEVPSPEEFDAVRAETGDVVELLG